MKKKLLVMITVLVGLSLVLGGCIGNAGAASWLGRDLTADKIESIRLTDLNGEVVRELAPAEYEGIVDALKKAKTDDSAYIMMLAGYMMEIKLPDGQIQITSYGSETNVVAAVTIGNETRSQHLVCPEIAQILTKDLHKDTAGSEQPES